MFQLEHICKQSGARKGTLTLSRGITLETPLFMPVGTRGSVKTLTQEDLEQLQAKMILGNTYHLYLRPGDELIKKMGGLHQFISWPHALLTDSGGFQVFSLKTLNKLREEGVTFRSHIDGSYHLLSPERSLTIQRNLGADIVMAFDECPPLPSTQAVMEESILRTNRWLERSLSIPLQDYQHFFAINQGGQDFDLRLRSLHLILEMKEKYPGKISGLAIGGLAVGETTLERESILTAIMPHFPTNTPRYLMGVGKPLDLLAAISKGVDMFDCVLPCRNARNGQAFTSTGPLNLKNLKYLSDDSPIDPNCSCKVCKRYTKSYIRHLTTVGEYLAGQLLTYHNIHFYLELMRQSRVAISEDRFDDFYQKFYKCYTSSICK